MYSRVLRQKRQTNKLGVLLVFENAEAELCSKEATKMTAFVIKTSLRLLRILNIFLLYFQKYFESANSAVAFIKTVTMLTFLLVFHTS